jgi:hypothetical protein
MSPVWPSAACGGRCGRISRLQASAQVTELHRRLTDVSRHIQVRRSRASERPDLTWEALLPNVSSYPERAAVREGRWVRGSSIPLNQW